METMIPTASNQNEQIVLDMFDAFNAKDLGRVKALMTTDVTWTPMVTGIPIAGTYVGDEIFDVFLAPIFEIYAPGDPKYDTTSIASGGSLVFAEVHGHGRVSAKERDYSNTYAWVFEMHEEKIAAVREYFDTAYAIRTLLE